MNNTTTEEPTEYPIQRLMYQLATLGGTTGKRPADRGALAALRAWSRRGSQHLAYATLANLFAKSGVGSEGLNDPIWTAIPTLYAWHRRHDPAIGGGLGKTLRKVAGAKREAFDTHFRRLLACADIGDLIGTLPRYIRRAEAAHVPVDFVRLFWDLRQWSRDPESARAIRVRWASEYFAETSNESTADAA